MHLLPHTMLSLLFLGLLSLGCTRPDSTPFNLKYEFLNLSEYSYPGETNPPHVKLQWTFQSEGGYWGDPIIENDKLYIGGYRGDIHALNPQDGKLLWRFETDEKHPSFLEPVTFEKSVLFAR